MMTLTAPPAAPQEPRQVDHDGRGHGATGGDEERTAEQRNGDEEEGRGVDGEGGRGGVDGRDTAGAGQGTEVGICSSSNNTFTLLSPVSSPLTLTLPNPFLDEPPPPTRPADGLVREAKRRTKKKKDRKKGGKKTGAASATLKTAYGRWEMTTAATAAVAAGA